MRFEALFFSFRSLFFMELSFFGVEIIFSGFLSFLSFLRFSISGDVNKLGLFDDDTLEFQHFKGVLLVWRDFKDCFLGVKIRLRRDGCWLFSVGTF